MLKISFDYMHKDLGIKKILKKKDPLEYERVSFMEDFGLENKSSLGKIY
jgi:hypothetical protein